MEQFFHTLFSFPAAPMSVLLGVVLLYWLFVILGAVGIDALDGGAEGVSGGVKAAGEALSAVKGATHALTAVKGAGDAAAGAVKGAGEAAKPEVDGGLFTLLGIGHIPVTITLSSVIFFGWIATLFGTNLLGATTLLPQAGVLAASVVLGLCCSALALRPLRSTFEPAKTLKRGDLQGRLCTISSGKVSAGFGTATLDDGGAGLSVHVSCEKDNSLKKGDRALLLDYDAGKDTWTVEPLDWLEPQEVEALKDPEKAAQVLSTRVRSRG